MGCVSRSATQSEKIKKKGQDNDPGLELMADEGNGDESEGLSTASSAAQNRKNVVVRVVQKSFFVYSQATPRGVKTCVLFIGLALLIPVLCASIQVIFVVVGFVSFVIAIVAGVILIRRHRNTRDKAMNSGGPKLDIFVSTGKP